jgi:hypothetical protein
LDHQDIVERHLIDRYVQGRLSATEAELFEEHYLTCTECLRELDLAERFHRGLRSVATAEAAGATTRTRLGLLLLSLPRLGRSRQAALALAAVLLLALLPAGLLTRRVADLEHRLEEAHSAAARPDGPDGKGAPVHELAEAREELADQRNLTAQRERELAAEQEARQRLARELAEARHVPAATVVYPLGPVRSGPAAGEPPYRITLPSREAWLVLALDPGFDGPARWGATVEREGGATVWRGEQLPTGPAGTVALSLRSAALVPGDYLVRLTAEPEGAAEPPPVVRYRFRALPG